MKPCKRKRDGFTLIEALVALTIFAVIAIICYGAIDGLITTRTILTEETSDWKRIIRVVERLESDLRNAAQIPIRNEYGVVRPPMESLGNGSFELTRYANPWNSSDVGIERIRYRLEDHILYYEQWPTTNRVTGVEPVSSRMIEGITQTQITYLGESGVWTDVWVGDTLPLAVTYRIEFFDGEEVTRVVALARF